MPLGSNSVAYQGSNSKRPSHDYSFHASSSRSTASHDHQAYRLSTYQHGQYSTPVPSSASPGEIEAAHKARVAKETEAILARFNKQ
ncbi:hypothetical protein F5Y15DRAFT_369118 [Xylariaceae sp. FL0016]|nr:hypothetical protein F5Y15DRAFT_369118 [Xylariaceae sp. FL0016]